MRTLIAAGLAASVLASGSAASADPVVMADFHHAVPHGVVMMVPPAVPVVHRRIVYGPGYPAPGYFGGYRYGYGYGYGYGHDYGWRYRDHYGRRDHDGWRDRGHSEWRDHHGGDHGDRGE